eukprot:scaffold1147_cov172-Amphora_coffeaeformis.AAC.10
MNDQKETEHETTENDQEIALVEGMRVGVAATMPEKQGYVEKVKRKLSKEFLHDPGTFAAVKKEKQDDIIVPVCQKILVKRIVDDGDSHKVFLEATIVQQILGYGFCQTEELSRFDYRVNGAVPTDESVFDNRRRTKLLEKDSTGLKKIILGETFTIDAKMPLELVDEFNFFPFRIVRAKLQLELASPSLPSGTILRPNLWNFDSRSGGVPTDVLQLKKKAKNNTTGNSGTLLDALPNWDFVIENPERKCPIEKKNDKNQTEYHAKTELTWYMANTAMKSIDEEQDRKGHVATSVGIALTAVVLLEKILDGLNLKSAFDFNDTVFLFWLSGLGLSSVPERYSAALGVLLLGVSAISPLLAFVLFCSKLKQIRNRNQARVDFTTVPDEEAQKTRGDEMDLANWTYYYPDL